jgi:hypothetical protein
MLYSLRISEAMGVENNDKSSSNKDNRSNRSNSEADTKADLQFKDYKKLVKFNAEQK